MIIYLLLITLVIIATLFTFSYLFFIQPNMIIGISMVPTYPSKAQILTDKFSYRFLSPQQGDVVIFHHPTQEQDTVISRIIGLPNDRILIKEGNVYINDRFLPEPYIAKGSVTKSVNPKIIEENKVLNIPDNFYFIMGDNREHSNDSRSWGLVPRDKIIGKVLTCFLNCKYKN